MGHRRKSARPNPLDWLHEGGTLAKLRGALTWSCGVAEDSAATGAGYLEAEGNGNRGYTITVDSATGTHTVDLETATVTLVQISVGTTGTTAGDATALIAAINAESTFADKIRAFAIPEDTSSFQVQSIGKEELINFAISANLSSTQRQVLNAWVDLNMPFDTALSLAHDLRAEMISAQSVGGNTRHAIGLMFDDGSTDVPLIPFALTAANVTYGSGQYIGFGTEYISATQQAFTLEKIEGETAVSVIDSSFAASDHANGMAQLLWYLTSGATEFAQTYVSMRSAPDDADSGASDSDADNWVRASMARVRLVLHCVFQETTTRTHTYRRAKASHFKGDPK